MYLHFAHRNRLLFCTFFLACNSLMSEKGDIIHLTGTSFHLVDDTNLRNLFWNLRTCFYHFPTASPCNLFVKNTNYPLLKVVLLIVHPAALSVASGSVLEFFLGGILLNVFRANKLIGNCCCINVPGLSMGVKGRESEYPILIIV